MLNVFSRKNKDEIENPFRYAFYDEKKDAWNNTNHELKNLIEYFKQFTFKDERIRKIHDEVNKLLQANNEFRKETSQMTLKFLKNKDISPEVFERIKSSLNNARNFIDKNKNQVDIEVLQSAIEYCIQSLEAYIKESLNDPKFNDGYKKSNLNFFLENQNIVNHLKK